MMGRPPIPPETRFWHKVDLSGGTDSCWPWLAALNSYGYGSFSVNRVNRQAHRYAYEWLFEPIPEGMQIDHLCRNRACVNPFHMEIVSPRENTLRGYGVTASNARKTHCKNGHEFTEENTYVTPARPNARFCKICKNEVYR